MLAELLSKAPPDEVALATAYLCGAVPQEKLGVGWAGLSAAGAAPERATTGSDVSLDLSDFSERNETSSRPYGA